MKLLMIAAPGGGKGTQGDRLAAKFGVRHISSGDVLRAEVRAGPIAEANATKGTRAFTAAPSPCGLVREPERNEPEGRTAMLPLSDGVPARRFPVVTVLLIVANFAVWLFYELPGLNSAIYHASFYPCTLDGACHGPEPWGLSWITAIQAREPAAVT